MVYERRDSERDKVSWNIAARQANLIASLVEKAMNFYFKGDIGNYYWTFTGIRKLINCELKKEEKGKFDEMESEAVGHKSGYDKYVKAVTDGLDSTNPTEEMKKDKIAFSGVASKYQLKIMDLLKELGYLPSKEDRSKLGF